MIRRIRNCLPMIVPMPPCIGNAPKSVPSAVERLPRPEPELLNPRKTYHRRGHPTAIKRCQNPCLSPTRHLSPTSPCPKCPLCRNCPKPSDFSLAAIASSQCFAATTRASRT